MPDTETRSRTGRYLPAAAPPPGGVSSREPTLRSLNRTADADLRRDAPLPDAWACFRELLSRFPALLGTHLDRRFEDMNAAVPFRVLWDRRGAGLYRGVVLEVLGDGPGSRTRPCLRLSCAEAVIPDRRAKLPGDDEAVPMILSSSLQRMSWSHSVRFRLAKGTRPGSLYYFFGRALGVHQRAQRSGA